GFLLGRFSRLSHMPLKVMVDERGQKSFILDYELAPSDMADFAVSRYVATGNLRRLVLRIRLLMALIVLVAVAILAFRSESLTVALVSLVPLTVVAGICFIGLPTRQLKRYRRAVMKLLSKDPSPFGLRRLTITP